MLFKVTFETSPSESTVSRIRLRRMRLDRIRINLIRAWASRIHLTICVTGRQKSRVTRRYNWTFEEEEKSWHAAALNKAELIF